MIKNKLIFLIVILVAIMAAWLITKNNFSESPQAVKQKNNLNQMTNKTVILETNQGNIKLELLANEAPETVANFLQLASEGFYDGTRFHRVIKDFMIQGGDPLSKDVSKKQFWGTGGPGYVFKDEINNVKLVAGVIAMANAGPNTNGSQFFIITADETPWLQGKHTGFGRVMEGIDIVMKISNVKTEGPDRPISDVVINKVSIQ